MKSILSSLTLTFLTVALASAETLTVATFNTEHLNKTKVHVKYGLHFDPGKWTDEQEADWAPPEVREEKFIEAVLAVAPVVASIDTDVLILCEVGKEPEVEQLVNAVNDAGISYPHVAVCKSDDSTTGQHVAILSKLPLVGDVLLQIPGREGYELEIDDPDEEKDTGISKGIRVTVEKGEEQIHIYGLHLKSERGGYEDDAQRIAQASIVRRHALPLLNEGKRHWLHFTSAACS